MGADTNLLKGEVSENAEQQEVDVQHFLAMFLRELVAEQTRDQGPDDLSSNDSEVS